MNKTTEKLHGVPGDANVVRDSKTGLFMAKGAEFNNGFMAKYAIPMRQQVAEIMLGAHIQSGVDIREFTDHERSEFLEDIWNAADDFVLMSQKTLQSRMGEYWELYMDADKDVDQVIDELIDLNTDYSL